MCVVLAELSQANGKDGDHVIATQFFRKYGPLDTRHCSSRSYYIEKLHLGLL
jgi:hypothetical protein